MKPLTAVQRRALHLASHRGGVTVASCSPLPKGQVSSQTAHRLLEAGFASLVNGTLLVSKAGRAKLNEPIPEDPPVWCAKSGGIKYKTLPGGRQVEDKDGAESLSDHGYTTNRSRASDDLEVLPIPPRRDWLEHSAALHLASRRDVDALRLSGVDPLDGRVAELKRMASERGVDVSDELRFVDRGLRALERKVRKAA